MGYCSSNTRYRLNNNATRANLVELAFDQHYAQTSAEKA